MYAFESSGSRKSLHAMTIGAFIGARVVIATEGKTLSIFGMPLASAQLLMLLHVGVWALLVGILAFKRRGLDAKEKEMAA